MPTVWISAENLQAGMSTRSEALWELQSGFRSTFRFNLLVVPGRISLPGYCNSAGGVRVSSAAQISILNRGLLARAIRGSTYGATKQLP